MKVEDVDVVGSELLEGVSELRVKDGRWVSVCKGRRGVKERANRRTER